MTRQRFIMLMIAALIAISGALYLSTQRNLPRDPHGLNLFPSLASELDTVTALSVQKGGPIPAVTVHKQGEQWTVAERANYPADVAKLRKLLLAMSEAKIREEKTSNPANYAIIGVEDPSQAGATGAQLEVTARDGKHAVIVGKAIGDANFARRAGEKTSYIVEPVISFEAQPQFWIDARLLDLPSEKIQSIEIKPASGASFSVHRVAAVPGGDAKPGAPNGDKFVLDPIPVGRQAADPAVLAPTTMLTSLNTEDVTAAGDIDFSKPSLVTVTLADGSVLTFTGVVIGDKHWLQIAAPKDAALTAKASGRAFDIAGYRYDSIFKSLEQLLAPKPPPAGAKKPVNAPKP
jgi:hypothetical protein